MVTTAFSTDDDDNDETQEFVHAWQNSALNLLEHELSLYIAVRDTKPRRNDEESMDMVLVNVATLVPEQDADELIAKVNVLVDEILGRDEAVAEMMGDTPPDVH